MIKSKSYIAIPPGETIKEQLEYRKLTQKEFSARMEMTEKHISKLLNGQVQLTNDVALRLEMVLGVPAKFWNNLEARYREKIVLAEQENAMDEDIEFAKKIPYSELVKMGWLETANRKEDKVFNLRRFFEVVRLSLLQSSQITKIACRRLSQSEKSDCCLLVWAQKARLEAREIQTEPINLKLLQDSLVQIKFMTMESPDVFCDKLKDLLRQCGIAIVFLPHFGGSFLHGATFVDGKKIVIGLTVRGKDADKFWFSLFHEIGHILLGHINNFENVTTDDETQADEFARNTLISQQEFDLFVDRNAYNKTSIRHFAKRNCIDPGIVVGRLQKEGYIQFSWLNDLKTKYIIQ